MKTESRAALTLAALIIASVVPRTAAAASAREEASFDTPPHVTEMVRPAYPEPARSDGVQGLVRLSLVVAADGTPGPSEVVKDVEGHPELAEAAAEAVAQWRFEPAKKDGEAVAARIVIPVRFQLEGRTKPEGRTKRNAVAPDGR